MAEGADGKGKGGGAAVLTIIDPDSLVEGDEEWACRQPGIELAPAEWLAIQAECTRQGHFSKEDKAGTLARRIQSDAKALGTTGVSLDVLEKCFVEIRDTIRFKPCTGMPRTAYPSLALAQTSQVLRTLDASQARAILDAASSLPANPRWCLWGVKEHMFHDRWAVFCFTYGGAEYCPFHSRQDPRTRRQRGYCYGSHDWLVYDTARDVFLHIGDLLMHQIVCHGFFQSPSSPYRVDPVRLVHLLDLSSSSSLQQNKSPWVRAKAEADEEEEDEGKEGGKMGKKKPRLHNPTGLSATDQAMMVTKNLEAKFKACYAPSSSSMTSFPAPPA